MATFDLYNQEVQRVGSEIHQEMISTGRTLGIQHRANSPSPGDSLSKIKVRFGEDKSGVINRVSFTQINRSLIYTSVGAGKGKGGRKGSRWLDKNGNRRRTDPDSLGKMDTGNRKAKPFISSTLDGENGIEKLADTVASFQADAIIESVYIK